MLLLLIPALLLLLLHAHFKDRAQGPGKRECMARSRTQHLFLSLPPFVRPSVSAPSVFTFLVFVECSSASDRGYGAQASTFTASLTRLSNLVPEKLDLVRLLNQLLSSFLEYFSYGVNLMGLYCSCTNIWSFLASFINLPCYVGDNNYRSNTQVKQNWA